jgi:hypothetical protein
MDGSPFQGIAREAAERVRREAGEDARKKANGHAGGETEPELYHLEGPEEFLRLRKPRFVIPGLVPDGGTFLLFSPSGHYKTTLVLLLFVLAANGRSFDGGEQDPIQVVIVANEDAYGVKLRLRALAERHGLSLENVRVLASGDFRLNLPEHRAKLVATVRTLLPGWRPALVIDHYDVSVTEKPTDPETGGAARDGLRELLGSGLFICAGLLAHTPWTTPERAKLPVSLWANMDARMGLTKRDDGTAELAVEHVKSAPSGFKFEVRLHKVTVDLDDGAFETIVAEIATDQTGAPIKAAIGRKGSKRELSQDQKTAIKAVLRATLERPAERPPCLDIPANAALTTEVAAIEMIARLVPSTKRTGKERPAFAQREHARRLFGGLHERYLVRVVDGVCWVSPRAAEVGE